MTTGKELQPFQGNIYLYKQLGSCQIVLSLKGDMLSGTGLQASSNLNLEGKPLFNEDGFPESEWAAILSVGQPYSLSIDTTEPEGLSFSASARLDFWSLDRNHLRLSLSFLESPPELTNLLKSIAAPVLVTEKSSPKNFPKARKRFSSDLIAVKSG